MTRPPNPPGQPSLAYRLDRHAGFLESMIAALPREEVPSAGGGPPARPLEALRTRSLDDPAIALLDAWAMVADVLAFYQERIANEGFLRTATERRSLLELARSIGYELNPGLAAGAQLAVEIEDAKGAPGRARIDTGLRVLSVPAQDEHPQTFETVEGIEARADWNGLRARTRRLNAVAHGDRSIRLRGTATRLQRGDAILLAGVEREQDPDSERWDVRVLDEVEPRPGEQATIVRFRRGLGRIQPWVDPSPAPTVYALRRRAAVFGHNAPAWKILPDDVRKRYAPGTNPLPAEWPGFAIDFGTEAAPELSLDAIHPDVVPGSWVVLVGPAYTELARVTRAVPRGEDDFGLSAQVTHLTVDRVEHREQFGRRGTVVLCASEALERDEEPIAAPVAGSLIELAGPAAGLATGHPLLVAGETATGPAAEPALLAGVATDAGGYATLQLAAPLTGSYRRETVIMHANVVRATHGESVAAVLGSGDSSVPNQRFTLNRPPLTYVSAATPSGGRSALTVRVDDVEWDEVPTLHGQGPEARVYMVRIDDAGTASVQFGDGEAGARLPSGRDNVRATYRTGLGPEGEVGEGRLMLLQTRPLGVRGVSNPRPATGSAPPERLEEARRNAPMTVMTLDRVASLQDYEDFARAFGGVGKAQAAEVWDAGTQVVHLTLSASTGAPVDPRSDEMANLRAALDAVRDPVAPVELAGHRALRFALGIGVYRDRRRTWEDVETALRAALLEAFAFEARELGQPITTAEVMRVAQAVPGVVAVDVDPPTYAPAPPEGPPPEPRRRRGRPRTRTATSARLAAFRAYLGPRGIEPADLLLIDPARLAIRDLTA